jgi:hypothetical protein
VLLGSTAAGNGNGSGVGVGVENIDVSGLIRGHGDYRCQLANIMDLVKLDER